MSTILLRDPWSIDTPGDWVKNHDTGWGNRLMAWVLAFDIAKNLNSKHRIEVLENEFPEIHNVNLPHTSIRKPTSNLLGGPLVPPSYHIINNKTIINWIKSGELDLDPNLNYTTHYDFDCIVKYIDNTSLFPVSKIKLKNPNLYNSIKDYSKNIIGLHIRRGHGVLYSSLDWDQIPSHVKKFYDPCFECDKAYRIVNDYRIFEIIEYFLSNTPHKIYISIDIDEKAIDYYKNKYPNKILTRNDFIQSYPKVIKESQILNPICGLKSIGYNLIDFFILSECKFILQSLHSTWSQLATKINNNPYSILHNHLDDIIIDYNEFFTS